jgi:NAD-dependent dihydropyrimidine dehydrogenase PreA subunit
VGDIVSGSSKEYQTARRIRRKKLAIEFMGGKCEMCEKSYPHYVYEFHHVVPTGNRRQTGRRSIGTLLVGRWATVEKELKKCILLCANCHKVIHAKLRGEVE